MDKKDLKILVLVAIIIFVLGFGYVLLLKSFDKNKNKKIIDPSEIEEKISNYSNEEKKILNIVDKKEDENDNETKEFKEFKKLSDKEKAKIEVVPNEKEVKPDDIDTIKEKIKYNDKEEIPSRFNLADKLDIKVEDQGSYGLCWAFASMKTLETYMQLHGEGVHNFSEIHIDYVMSDKIFGWRTIHQGGNFQIFEQYLLKAGVVEEEPNEYHDYTKDEYVNFLDKKPATIVTETITFSSPNNSLIFRSDVTEEEITEFRNVVKSHIMKNGALYAVVYDPAIFISINNGKNVYCGKDGCTSGRGNHAVALVGWDDNYSKNNFKDDHGNVPEHDGAYIVLNSWGDWYGDKGYLYVSYDDKYIESQLSGIISTSLDHAHKVSDFKSPEIKKVLYQEHSFDFFEYENEEYISNLALNSINSINITDKPITNDDISELTKLKQLFVLNLSNTNLEDISFLKNFTKLSMLDISNNSVKDVSQLGELSKLASLNLSNNKGVVGYDKLTNLYMINLSGCGISKLNLLNNISKLSDINLSNNNIGNLDELDLKDKEFMRIDLSNNNITKLPDWSNINFAYLNLDNNNLESLNGLPLKILELSISGNKKIKDFSNLNNIDSENFILKAHNCDISDPHILIRNEFYELDLSNNDIKDINLVNDLNVYTLNLSNNNVEDLSNYNNSKIKLLNLSHNKNLKNIKNLNTPETLVLSDCGITSLDEIQYLDNIVNLDLSNNDIKDISNLDKLSKLSTLSLAHNKNLSGFTMSDSLLNLNVEDCNIIDFDITKFKNLWYINLSNNKLFNYKKFFTELNDYRDYFNISFSNFKVDKDILELLKNKKNIGLDSVNIFYDLSDSDDYEIKPLDYLLLYDILKSNFKYKIINGKINKQNYWIDVIDPNQDLVINNGIYYNENGTYISDLNLTFRFKK